MTFEAKLFIQGVGCYVPHEDDKKMLVLFPDQEHADSGDLTELGHEICNHYAVVQLDSRSLGIGGPSLWVTMDVQKHWVGVEAVGAGGMTNIVSQLSPHLPAMAGALGAAGHANHSPLRTDVLPGKGGVAKRLKGGLFLQQGIVGAANGYQSDLEFRWSDGADLDTDYKMQDASGALEVRFGSVTSFSLHLRPFGKQVNPPIPLQPVENKLEIWVRHFCDLNPPEPPTVQLTPEPDADFMLTYALRPSVRALLNATGDKVPIPHVNALLTGGKPRQCMGVLETTSTFDNPFDN